MFSPRYVYTTTTTRPFASVPIVTNRRSPSASSSSRVIARGIKERYFCIGKANAMLLEIDPRFHRVPFDLHITSICTLYAHIKYSTPIGSVSDWNCIIVTATIRNQLCRSPDPKKKGGREERASNYFTAYRFAETSDGQRTCKKPRQADV